MLSTCLNASVCVCVCLFSESERANVIAYLLYARAIEAIVWIAPDGNDGYKIDELLDFTDLILFNFRSVRKAERKCFRISNQCNE